ncbi:MAG: hypothetical protein J6P54_09675, partial [Bacteroidales bacterium]|nr:hypothetical protein [Bacteroidales bacterium]
QTVITFIVLLFSTIGGISAQTTDTMYVVKRHVVRDTVYVRDTLRVQDTVIIADYIHSEEFKQLFYELNGADAQTSPDSLEKLWAQTVTFLENRVIQYEQQNVSTMDSIKKYGLAGLLLLGLNSLAPAQTETTKPVGEPHQIETKSALHDDSFNGFHFGYTMEADVAHPLTMTNAVTGVKSTHSFIRYGGRFGLECSYHFADLLGVSAALDFGYIAPNDHYANITRYYGLSMPLKFEFHYPVSDKLWLTANAGVQLRMPFETFSHGFNRDSGEPLLYNNIAGNPAYYEGYYNRYIFYADIMADVGLYFQLPNQDYLRFLLGLNIATTDFARGSVRMYSSEGYDDLYFSQRNHYLYGQIAYVHSFSKQRALKQAQPHWNEDKSFYRHEFRLGVSDHFGFVFHREIGGNAVGENLPNTVCTDLLYTPVFSFDYHYRAAKWFWLGLSTGYGFYKESHYPDGIVSPDLDHWVCKQHNFLIMPSLRFSYLNRPHITLYSGLDMGLLIVRRTPERMIQFVEEGFSPDDDPSDWPDKRTDVFSAFQLTAFGLKAGAKHWFGSFEAGVGIKGFVNLGVGYEF